MPFYSQNVFVSSDSTALDPQRRIGCAHSAAGRVVRMGRPVTKRTADIVTSCCLATEAGVPGMWSN
jgi:hypothetical protein